MSRLRQVCRPNRPRSGWWILVYSVIFLASALAIGGSCTAVLRSLSKGPQNLFVVVEDKSPDVDTAWFHPRQVRVDIGSRCIVGHALDGTQLLLLFEVGRDLVASNGERRITQVFKPDTARWRQMGTEGADSSSQTGVEPRSSLEARYVVPGGMVVLRDGEGFWIDEQGHDPLTDELASVGDVVSGEIMLVSTRPFAPHRLKWITTPHPECEDLPYAYVPLSYPS